MIFISTDASQLQTFTNIALITQCEDASSVDRLTSLEAVATKLAPVIFQLPKTAGMTEFMDQCYCIRKETLEDVSGQIVCCSMMHVLYCTIYCLLCGKVQDNVMIMYSFVIFVKYRYFVIRM